MIWRQVTVDIFLIDWEHPRVEKSNSLFVSAWRTYFVANKWHDLQTIRKTNIIIQLAVTIIVLKVSSCDEFNFWYYFIFLLEETKSSYGFSNMNFHWKYIFRGSLTKRKWFIY